MERREIVELFAGADEARGNSKFILDRHHNAAFAAAIERLLSDHTLFDRLRYAARALVVQTYDWQVIGQQLQQAIDMLMENNAHA